MQRISRLVLCILSLAVSVGAESRAFAQFPPPPMPMPTSPYTLQGALDAKANAQTMITAAGNYKTFGVIPSRNTIIADTPWWTLVAAVHSNPNSTVMQDMQADMDGNEADLFWGNANVARMGADGDVVTANGYIVDGDAEVLMGNYYTAYMKYQWAAMSASVALWGYQVAYRLYGRVNDILVELHGLSGI